jgi:hypothetical protein
VGLVVRVAVPTRPSSSTRVELFTPEVWADYLAISAGDGGWQAGLDRWGVTVLAISRDEQAGLLEALASDPGWEAAQTDDEGAVYVRADRPA